MHGTILIAAGGTGGHLFPGISVADALQRRRPDLRVVFVGTRRGLEVRLVPRAGYPLEVLPVRPLNSVGVARALLGLLALPGALVRAFLLLRRTRPEAVFGVGGYASGPLLLVAALLGVKTVILEPNARPGFTNRALRPFVWKAACAYSETLAFFPGKGVLTGTPVRGGFTRSATRHEHASPWTLLAFGGSQGSRVLNQALVKALPHLPGGDVLRIVHQTGEAMRDEVARAYAAAERKAEVVAFLDDMEARFAEADLVVARSGATTCAEITASGKAAVLVPFAKAADDHQTMNARALQAEGAALVIPEEALTGEALAAAVLGVLETGGRLTAMQEASSRLGRPMAAEAVADLLTPEEGKA